MNAGELHRVARALREIATSASADPGEERVSAGDLAIVEDIAHHDATSVGQIAGRTGLAQSLVSITVASMRAAGVLTSVTDPEDRRRVLISIDPAARSQLLRARGARPVTAALRERFPKSSKRELAHMERLLEELTRLLLH